MLDNYVSRSEARATLNLSRDQMIYRIKKGHIAATKVGYFWVIPTSELTRVPETEWYKALRHGGNA